MGVNEEYSKIVEVVTRYSIHYPMIKFSCRKMDDKKTDISTHNVTRPTTIEEEDPKETERMKNQIRMEIIKKTYGQNSAGKEFIDVVGSLDMFRYSLSAILSKPN